MSTSDRYLRPGWFTKHVANRAARRLARMGVAPKGLRQLAVRGRTSGEWRSVPVNLLELDGARYLVAPRGHTEWVRNIRVAGGGELRLGRKVEPIRVRELADEDKPAILRAYLVAWKAEVKMFFSGIDEHSTDEQLLEVAPGFPVFEVLAG
ncbi:MAG: nitroreductase family deazaflavin-dependent oxidoreductase [Actinomycetota bacterium]|nr:nitroreductase family deazaflavin-dependent oxidoreductase [Actinomycetota bacterium]